MARIVWYAFIDSYGSGRHASQGDEMERAGGIGDADRSGPGVLTVELGNAMVVRNAGGRVTADVLKDLAYIGYLAGALVPGGPRFEVAVVHHTQCGTHFLADGDFRRGFADIIGADDADLARHAVTDPEQTVRLDVELLRSAAVLPDMITVSGHVYDVTTGLVTTIIPAAPMHARISGPTAESAGAPASHA